MNNEYFEILFREDSDILWEYNVKGSSISYEINAPSFEVDGKVLQAKLENINLSHKTKLSNGSIQYSYEGKLVDDPDLYLEMIFRIAADNPVVRFQYRLSGDSRKLLTKLSGEDNLSYLGINLAEMNRVKEVQFSQFREDVHSFTLNENDLEDRSFTNELSVMGPMLVAANENYSSLIAYEHGSQVPDAYLHFNLARDKKVKLEAVKGNYYSGQPVGEDNSFETIWFQFAVVEADENYLAEKYRHFVLKYMSQNLESRKPYIFYNTWAYQERNKWWNNKTFLDSMKQERILKEIDVAHQMGIEVFVIDTGWYQKTGDWQVNLDRFSKNLKVIKEKLDDYGMKLGLWFDPTAAAVSSQIVEDNPECIISSGGKQVEPIPIWETEESYKMCLVSKYADEFADRLISLIEEVGVSYFKWDAISQYGCDDPNHWHGNEDNPPEERAACYSFELGRMMIKIVDKVCNACPEAIIDFDITEGGRFVGLGFLSAGKYFLINNGPYYENYDIPVADDKWINMLVYPGQARAWNCRKPLNYDKWIPSILFLTHYLPDDPQSSQIINMASLILGHNGIWGDLLDVSSEGVKLIHDILAVYKQVRDDITESFPVRTGVAGGSPEIHEKIFNGKGAIVIFATARGSYNYVSKNKVEGNYITFGDGIQVELDEEGRASFQFEFEEPGAKIIFFGVDN